MSIRTMTETPTEELLESGLEGLLPLLPLTREGKKREVVEYAIERLMPADGGPKPDLLTLTYGIASLVFNKEDDHKWLQRRFSMLRDILSESWAFKEIEEEALERGRKMGREEGREEGFEQGYAKSQKEQLAGLRATFLTLVQTRFPDLVPTAKKKARSVRTPIAMQALILGIACARDCDEAWKHLVTES